MQIRPAEKVTSVSVGVDSFYLNFRGNIFFFFKKLQFGRDVFVVG